MKVFLGWSGDRSKEIALALRDWLPDIVHFAEPWMSEADISAGQRWGLEVGRRLQESDFGILCVTGENVSAPWLLFEAGALSKSLSDGAVIPYLLDLQFSAISNSPLGQFQAKKIDQAGTHELVTGINARAPEPVPALRLQRLFERFWPDLQARIGEIRPPESVAAPPRPQADVLEDLVSAMRSMENRLIQMERAGGTVSDAHVDELANWIDLDIVREYVSQAVRDSSYRSVALDVGVSAETVRRMVNGELFVTAGSSTGRQLRRWYASKRLDAARIPPRPSESDEVQA